MYYIFIHMDHWWHLVYSKVIISVENPSILRDFLSLFSQHFLRPFSLQQAYIGMTGVLIAWFCVPMTKIGNFQSMTMLATTLCKNVSGYR